MRLPSSLFARHHVRLRRFHPVGKPGILAPLNRNFLTATSQTISASHILPYSRKDLYSVIADISSYPSFLPYCNSAKVLGWSRPDRSQRRWPARAVLGVGWGAIEEQYVSRVYCIPEQTVEALAGEAKTNLPSDQLRDLYEGINYGGASNDEAQYREGHLFRSLRSTWSLQDEGGSKAHPTTRVNLKIDFDFQNPIYAAMAGAAVPKVAQAVIDAFQARAETIIGQKKSGGQ
jgi:coenzyme Q-binding protein COQ10